MKTKNYVIIEDSDAKPTSLFAVLIDIITIGFISICICGIECWKLIVNGFQSE